MSRVGIVECALACVTHNGSFLYGEDRPIPLDKFLELMNGTLPEGEKITTDCSGLVECVWYRNGEPDPSGLNYSGYGFTGTLLETLKHIPFSLVKPGDVVVFGEYPGRHAVIVVGTGPDPEVVSHGHPGTPEKLPLSAFMSIGTPTYLQGLTPPKKQKPHRPVEWIVTGDEGQIIGQIHKMAFARARWRRKHRRVLRNQKHHEHYDHVPTKKESA